MMSNVHIRIDNRLLHGQVVQFWIGHLSIGHLVVADDETAQNESMPIIYRMALPDTVKLTVIPISRLEETLAKTPITETMVLLRDVEHATHVVSLSAKIQCVVLGNIHSLDSRSRVTDSVYLSDAEIESLAELNKHNIEVEIQTFPGEILRLVSDGLGGHRWLRP